MRYALILFVCLLSSQLSASHLQGGEITWECQSNGTYRFTLVIYRDCGGINLPIGPQSLVTNAGVNITCAYVGSTFINPLSTNSCAGSTSGLGFLEKYVFTSGDIALTGTPPASGWHFTWNSCCRPSSVTNITAAGSAGFYLRAIMYPFIPPGSTTALSTGTIANPTCYDSSPSFLEDPFVRACTWTETAYNMYGFDQDYDSIHFSFAQPLTGTIVDSTVSPPTTSTVAVNWSTGYTTTSPLPSGIGSTAANISNTGELTFNSGLTGVFAMCVMVEAWRSSQLIAAVYRDLPMYLANCNPPSGLCFNGFTSVKPYVSLSPLKVNNSWTPVINVGGDTSYHMNANVGETVQFTLRASDAFPLTNCSAQQITFSPSGVDTNQITSLNPGGVFTTTGINDIDFTWVIDSGDFNAGSIYNEIKPYNFYFTFKDNELPINKVSTTHIRINVTSDSLLSLPHNIPLAGLQVYYPLDTLGGNYPSASGDSAVGRDLGFYNHHWNAGSSYIPKTNRFGVPGGAMSYTQNVAQTPYSGVLGTESRSVSVWVKHKGYSSDPVFFQYGSQVAGKRFSGHVNYNCNGVGVGSAFSTTTNNQALDTNWHHIVYVLDTSQCSGNCSVTDVDVYVDGVMYPNCNVFNGSTAINTISTFDLQFIFGNSSIADSNRLALDDFGMWNRPLTQDEILDLYSGSTGPKAVADLQACYYSDDIVSLSWTAPADTGGDFLGFVIYRADSLNDSFRVVDTLYDYVSTYLDTTPYVPANYAVSCADEPYRYFIKTLDGFGRVSSSTDTVRNVVLEYRSYQMKFASAIWNHPTSDTIPLPFTYYQTNLWTNNWLVSNSDILFSGCYTRDFVDTIVYNCAGKYKSYKVQYGNGCFSNTDSIYNEDIWEPNFNSDNNIDGTFNAQNELELTFEEPNNLAQIDNRADQIDNYYLFIKDSTWLSNSPIDSIKADLYRQNLVWATVLTQNQILNKSRLYIVPNDTCGNINKFSGSGFGSFNIRPVYLDVEYNVGDFQLDWNAREVDSGNVFYSIYEAKYDGVGPGTYTLVSNALDTSADMSLSDSYENYCYYVSATSSTSNFVMESNRVCVSFVGMDENDFSFNLHPNPSNGSFLININSGNTGDYTMELVNNVGQIVYRTSLTNGDNRVTLNQQLAKGSYILVLKDDNSQAVKREVLILQ